VNEENYESRESSRNCHPEPNRSFLLQNRWSVQGTSESRFYISTPRSASDSIYHDKRLAANLHGIENQPKLPILNDTESRKKEIIENTPEIFEITENQMPF